MTCSHGFIGPCAECDGAGQQPEREIAEVFQQMKPRVAVLSCSACGEVTIPDDGRLCAKRCGYQYLQPEWYTIEEDRDGAGQKPERAARSAAQRGRQEAREGTGRYANMPACHGGCGTRINAEGGDYFSHALSDTLDREGVNWGDRALLLCATCADESAACQTVREFKAFVRVKVSARLAAAKANARKLAEEFEL